MTQPDGGQSPYDPPQQPLQPEQGQQTPPPGAVPGQPAPYEQSPYQQQAPQGPAYAQGAQPYAYGAAPLPKNNLGVWSLVLGILAVLGCGILTGIAAIVTGHKSRKAQREGQADNGAMGLVGIVTGWVGIAWTTVLVGFLVVGAIMAATAVNDPAFQEELRESYEQDLGDTGQTMDPELEELMDELENLENG
ncbi:DUF4190 domain-containing protein [Promicromonospora soli]|uniref:DUF4190 domain-containing protein n=1 Tax=Promicromonospora soli TaxID=2035533 RepID=A0A919FGM8_9MICO|nr:DUF4190 domain-containing protein [Promicromonospora soli]GHH64735.1 hypothetical protein GCM10017772_01660 [Promicromonospora soli]